MPHVLLVDVASPVQERGEVLTVGAQRGPNEWVVAQGTLGVLTRSNGGKRGVKEG